MEVRQGRQARARPVFPLREGHVSQGSTAEHSTVEQGPGSDSEARARGGTALPDADFESTAQVRVWPAQRSLATSIIPIRHREVRTQQRRQASWRVLPPT